MSLIQKKNRFWENRSIWKENHGSNKNFVNEYLYNRWCFVNILTQGKVEFTALSKMSLIQKIVVLNSELQTDEIDQDFWQFVQSKTVLLWKRFHQSFPSHVFEEKTCSVLLENKPLISWENSSFSSVNPYLQLRNQPWDPFVDTL